MAYVELKSVTKKFDSAVTAVDNSSFIINDKEFVVLVGPSGCGKSTTLRMIAGLDTVTEGEIYIDDMLVNDIPPKDRDIAMVFQNYALYPHMTVYQNMAFGLKLRKFTKKEIDARVREAAEILEIENLLDRKPKALSGGQRQRVAVGRAIVRKPKVFLFDEPLSNLDAKLRVQMRTEISKLHQRLETTMIYVTHDQMEAMTMGDRIVIMKDGLVHQIDSPLNLYHTPKNQFVAGFIGSPSMNFITGKLTFENGFVFDEGTFRLEIPIKYRVALQDHLNKKIVLGIRPENINNNMKSSRESHSSLLKFHVDVVELMGNEIFVYLKTKYHLLIARMKPENIPNVGEEIEVMFDLQKLYFFDANIGDILFNRVDWTECN
ncbi:sn-glycerol-3-phosphate ABC transporter ATP-binding protein UgpC [candidate division KSB1 bacterium]|nr:sn-glycerol-3-phosphate ABC transporter ATP-binding protein UgpC [candidate division KSB1 bacterium]